MPVDQPWRQHNFDMVLENQLTIRLTTLLELDGGIARLMPNLKNRLDVLAADQCSRDGRRRPASRSVGPPTRHGGAFVSGEPASHPNHERGSGQRPA